MRRKLWIGLGVVLLVGVLAGLLLPALQPASEHHGPRSRCRSNLKQIGYGCHLYAIDHDEKFPPGFGHLYPDFLSDSKVFLCRMAKRATAIEDDGSVPLADYSPGMFTERHTDYAYVPGLRADDPKHLVVAYSREGNHEGGRWALFIGTNVEWMNEDEFQAALAKTREYLKAKESGGAR
ncbi:MAG: hypothetical protein ACYTFI_19490 [Planctomycetota bacterium]|jgi:hypothetical protein